MQKSIILLLILALIWLFGFPKLTSLAADIQADLSQNQAKQPADTLSLDQQMVQIISEVARQENFDNKDLVIAIARAESRLNPNVIGEIDHRDRGLFQINSHFNPGVSDSCAFDPWCSTRWTISELKAGHSWKWSASKYKWHNYLSNS